MAGDEQNGGREVHAMLAAEIRALGVKIDANRDSVGNEIRAECGAVNQNVQALREEINDRCAQHRLQIATDFRTVHKRIDDHLETHTDLRVSAKSDSRLPTPDWTLGSIAKFCTRIAAIGVVIGGMIYIFVLIHAAITAGIIK